VAAKKVYYREDFDMDIIARLHLASGIQFVLTPEIFPDNITASSTPYLKNT
jgi:hypothetical protein